MPAADSVYAYANSLQRTVATAQFFITGAFPGCDVPVHHQEKMGTMDPTFNPVITNNSPEFRDKALSAMASERQKMQLDESYKLLEQMTNYADSPSCKEKKVCSLTDAKDTFSADYEKEPGVSGPLKVGNSWWMRSPAVLRRLPGRSGGVGRNQNRSAVARAVEAEKWLSGFVIHLG
jgi:glucose-1-phosphatase